MGLSAADFASAPAGHPVPTSLELHALGIRGSGFAPAERMELMNLIGSLVGIPRDGWGHGQSRLFESGDVRLVWLLRRLARQKTAVAVAENVAAAGRFFAADVMLTVVTAAREHASSLSAVSMRPIETWEQGGLDFLATEVGKLGLPKSITGRWTRPPAYPSKETHKLVHPMEIPARDQVLAYAAQLNASFLNNFNANLRRVVQGCPAVSASAWTGSRIARTVWKAYAFLAPGGRVFDTARSVAQQTGRPFGHATALEYIASSAATKASRRDLLDEILTDPELNRIEWVRIAKARAAEALFLERLWRTTREILPL